MLDTGSLQLFVEIEGGASRFSCESCNRIVAGFTQLLPQPEIDGLTRENGRGHSGPLGRDSQAIVSFVRERHVEVLHNGNGLPSIMPQFCAIVLCHKLAEATRPIRTSSRYDTYMSKLTLSVDARVVSRAKRYAKQRGVSVSEMVEAYLAAVTEPSSPDARDAPILRSLRGSLGKADLTGYRKDLAAKYR